MRSMYTPIFIILMILPLTETTATTITNDVTVRANTGNQTSTGTNITTGEAKAEIYIETDLGEGAPPEVIHSVKENRGEVIIHATTTMETTSEQTTLHTTAGDGTKDILLIRERGIHVTETSTATSTEQTVTNQEPSHTGKNLLSYFTILVRWLASAMRSLFSWS